MVEREEQERVGFRGRRRRRPGEMPPAVSCRWGFVEELEEDGRPGVMFEVSPTRGRERPARVCGDGRDGCCWYLVSRLREMVFGVAFTPEMAIRAPCSSTRFGRQRQLMQV